MQDEKRQEMVREVLTNPRNQKEEVQEADLTFLYWNYNLLYGYKTARPRSHFHQSIVLSSIYDYGRLNILQC